MNFHVILKKKLRKFDMPKIKESDTLLFRLNNKFPINFYFYL